MSSAIHPTSTVVRTARLIEALADAEGEVGVNQLAERLGLAPSTVHRSLQLLCDEGFATWNPTTRVYSSGPSLYRIAARASQAFPMSAIITPSVEQLAARYNETVLFAMYLPKDRAMSFLVRSDGTQALQYRIDMHAPLSLLWGASGKAILAYLDHEEITGIYESEGMTSPAGGAELPQLTTLLEEMQRIRDAGVALSDSEKLPGARGIASPVFGAGGVVGALVLTSPLDRLPHGSVEEIATTIRSTAQRLSHALGQSARQKDLS
ncbi:IclR family transcriptional regulator [Leucobacter soli]|uniref:Transcriptional regulator KdgR n=1 Tax=Leucobacter soli TaxID=2812850 RepID=A0A916JZT2_9MICO|nr:IclR family transcriptional regulator [Leucobacter soli]CAG7619412.1 Transcriptional regulator KdgR [Leucobacter soli]